MSDKAMPLKTVQDVREAYIANILSDMDGLTTRLQAVAQEIQAVRLELGQTRGYLDNAVTALEGRLGDTLTATTDEITERLARIELNTAGVMADMEGRLRTTLDDIAGRGISAIEGIEGHVAERLRLETEKAAAQMSSVLRETVSEASSKIWRAGEDLRDMRRGLGRVVAWSVVLAGIVSLVLGIGAAAGTGYANWLYYGIVTAGG